MKKEEKMKKPIKLDANENPYSLPGNLREKIEKVAGQLPYNRYPDKRVYSLRQEISRYIDMPYRRIMVGNGSDELLLMLIMAFAGRGEKVVITRPSFTMYQFYAKAVGADLAAIDVKSDLSLDWQRFREEAAADNRGIIIFCSPNNPTGHVPRRDKLEQLIKTTDKIVVVDEAYYEFCGKTVIELTETYSNVVVTRTLSKAFGLAGLRVGYLIGNNDIIERLEEIRSPYNADSFSQECARLVLEQSSQFEKYWQKIIKERDTLFRSLNEMAGITPYPSEANFIMFNSIDPQVISEKAIYQQLKERDVLVRYLPQLPVTGDTLRVTAGKPEENKCFLKELKNVLKKV